MFVRASTRASETLSYISPNEHALDLEHRSHYFPNTIVAGAATPRSLIFSCGAEGHRYMGKYASIMLHDIRVEGMDGKCTDIQNEAREMKRNNDMLFGVMSKNCGHPKRYFRDMVRTAEHVDVYLSAKEARDHNICNHMGVPTLVHRVEHSLHLRRHRKKKETRGGLRQRLSAGV